MSISPDFFFDLTPKNNSTLCTYDFIESEFLAGSNKNDKVEINFSFSQNSSPYMQKKLIYPNNTDIKDQKCSKSKERFTITRIKKSSSTQNPVSFQTSKKYNICRSNIIVNSESDTLTDKSNSDLDDIIILF